MKYESSKMVIEKQVGISKKKDNLFLVKIGVTHDEVRLHGIHYVKRQSLLRIDLLY